jgi:hypothetical protein
MNNAIVTCLLVGAAAYLNGGPAVAGQELRGERIGDYLDEECERLDCYLTFERIKKPGLGGYAIGLGERERKATPVESVDALKARLWEIFPEAEVTESRVQEHRVLHVIEKPLLKWDDYGMDKKVAIRFRGYMVEFYKYLADHVDGITFSGVFPKKHKARADYVSEVDIDVKDVPVRQLLLKLVDLDGYSRIVFVVDAFEKDKSAEFVMLGPILPPGEEPPREQGE